MTGFLWMTAICSVAVNTAEATIRVRAEIDQSCIDACYLPFHRLSPLLLRPLTSSQACVLHCIADWKWTIPLCRGYMRNKIISKLDSLRWFSQRRSQRHIFEGAQPGGLYDPQMRTRPRLMYNARTPKFHHSVFTRSEVIVLTNKETNRRRWKYPTIFATLRRWVINYFSRSRRPSEIILFQRVETCLKLFEKCFTGLLQVTSISNMFTVAEIILK